MFAKKTILVTLILFWCVVIDKNRAEKVRLEDNEESTSPETQSYDFIQNKEKWTCFIAIKMENLKRQLGQTVDPQVLDQICEGINIDDFGLPNWETDI